MKRDSRPVSQQVLSGLMIGAVILAVGVGVLICYPYIPGHRIEAYIWHLRHGSTIDLAQHRVPVPKQWYVEHISEGNVIMVDLNTGDKISYISGFPNGVTLSAWSDLVSRAYASETVKMKTTGQRDFHINGETFRCIEQDMDVKAVHHYPIACLSDGGLEVHFMPYIGAGSEHDAAFYFLLQRIQKL